MSKNHINCNCQLCSLCNCENCNKSLNHNDNLSLHDILDTFLNDSIDQDLNISVDETTIKEDSNNENNIIHSINIKEDCNISNKVNNTGGTYVYNVSDVKVIANLNENQQSEILDNIEESTNSNDYKSNNNFNAVNAENLDTVHNSLKDKLMVPNGPAYKLFIRNKKNKKPKKCK